MPTEPVPMIGKRFGRLVVKAEGPRHPQSFHVMWECLCDCGTWKLISGNKLRQGHVKSCGCLKTKAGKLAYYGA